jgi:hypothetical protein
MIMKSTAMEAVATQKKKVRMAFSVDCRFPAIEFPVMKKLGDLTQEIPSFVRTFVGVRPLFATGGRSMTGDRRHSQPETR